MKNKFYKLILVGLLAALLPGCNEEEKDKGNTGKFGDLFDLLEEKASIAFTVVGGDTIFGNTVQIGGGEGDPAIAATGAKNESYDAVTAANVVTLIFEEDLSEVASISIAGKFLSPTFTHGSATGATATAGAGLAKPGIKVSNLDKTSGTMTLTTGEGFTIGFNNTAPAGVGVGAPVGSILNKLNASLRTLGIAFKLFTPTKDSDENVTGGTGSASFETLRSSITGFIDQNKAIAINPAPAAAAFTANTVFTVTAAAPAA